MLIAGSVAIVGILGAGGYLLPDSLPSIAALTDSPEGIMDDLVSVLKSTKSTLDSINDESSRDAAVSKLNSLQQECDEIMIRAVKFGPLEMEEYNALIKQASAELRDIKPEPGGTAEEKAKRLQLLTGKLMDASMGVTFAMADIESVIRKAWAPLPPPTDEKQELEHEILMLERRAWIAAMTSRGKEQAAIRNINEATGDLQALLDDRPESLQSKRLFSVDSPYFMKSFKPPLRPPGQSLISQEVEAAAAEFSRLRRGV
jgi:hypothetical protein